MNLIEMRARVREDLQDTDPADYHWTDDQVDGAIDRAVMEYSLAAPIERIDEVTTTLGDKELDISGLANLLKVESVEFPMDYPQPYYQRFQFWAGRLFMTNEGTGDDARVKWLQRHELTPASTTIPQEHQEILILGATAYLAMSAAAYAVDRASIAGRHATINYRAWGKERLARYDMKLRSVGQAGRVRQRTFYTEE